jgi:hypothetical protein
VVVSVTRMSSSASQQLHVGADAVLPMVVDPMVGDRTKPQRALAVSPPSLDGDELLVGGGEVVGGQRHVGSAQQPFAVEVGFAVGGGPVDAQPPAPVRRR